MDMSLSNLWEIAKDKEVGMLQSMVSQSVGRDLATEQQRSVNVMERLWTLSCDFFYVLSYYHAVAETEWEDRWEI